MTIRACTIKRAYNRASLLSLALSLFIHLSSWSMSVAKNQATHQSWARKERAQHIIHRLCDILTVWQELCFPLSHTHTRSLLASFDNIRNFFLPLHLPIIWWARAKKNSIMLVTCAWYSYFVLFCVYRLNNLCFPLFRCWYSNRTAKWNVSLSRHPISHNLCMSVQVLFWNVYKTATPATTTTKNAHGKKIGNKKKTKLCKMRTQKSFHLFDSVSAYLLFATVKKRILNKLSLSRRKKTRN